MHENDGWNDYIYRAISHHVNRKIIECLYDENLSFTDILNRVGVDGNHGKFGYHLRKLSKFVELDPTTKKYRLTTRGNLLADIIHDFNFMTSRRRDVSRCVESLRIEDHAVALYNDDDFKHQITFPFLRAGLLRGEAVVHVVAEDKLNSEIREIKKYGIDIDSLPNGAFTIMSADEWYLRKGMFEAETIITNWQTLIHEKKKAGFAGVSAAGEMEVFIRNGKIEDLLRYEESLGRQLAMSLCALCLFDKKTF